MGKDRSNYDSPEKNLGKAAKVGRKIYGYAKFIFTLAKDPTKVTTFITTQEGRQILKKAIIVLAAVIFCLIFFVIILPIAYVQSLFEGDGTREERVLEQKYIQWSRDSVDSLRPEQYEFMLHPEIIKAVDRLLYYPDRMGKKKNDIISSRDGLGPEFKYIVLPETIVETVKESIPLGITMPRGGLSDDGGNVNPSDDDNPLPGIGSLLPPSMQEVVISETSNTQNRQYLDEVITYNRKYKFIYEEKTLPPYEDITRRQDNGSSVIRYYITRTTHVLTKIEGAGQSEKDYGKLRAFFRRKNKGDSSAARENIDFIIKADEFLETDAGQRLLNEHFLDSTTMLGGEGIVIRNETRFPVNIQKSLTDPVPEGLLPEIGSDEPQVLIYHTHSLESYAVEDGTYKVTSSFSNDDTKNIVRVGEELKTQLEKLGIKTIHDTTPHQPPQDLQEYGRSLRTVETALNNNSPIKLIIDIHRDGLSGQRNDLLALRTSINGVPAAKCMFVIGTIGKNENLENPNWENNLNIAMKMQYHMNALYPGFMRYINLRRERFNQHLGKSAILIEVGGDGNTLGEALNSTKYLAHAIWQLSKQNVPVGSSEDD